MRTISVGDVHGRPYWKQIDPSKYDLIVFNGDYVDSYGIQDKDVIENLKEIIELKKTYPDKVVLLLGNHDIQYMFSYSEFGCSGFRAQMYVDLHGLFYGNKSLFNVAHQVGNHIWTHAGISIGWYKHNEKIIQEYWNKFKPENLAEVLNMILWTTNNAILHQVSDYRGGVYQYGGITWADRRETMNNYLPEYHQIVGHTPIVEITKFGDEKGSIRYIDVQGKLDQRKAEEAVFGKNDEFEKEFPITLFYECEI